MPSLTMKDVFDVPTYPKPRRLRQTWLKDVGYDEAPKYIERMRYSRAWKTSSKLQPTGWIS